MNKKLTVDELIDFLESYGCPKEKSEVIAVALICEHNYEVVRDEKTIKEKIGKEITLFDEYLEDIRSYNKPLVHVVIVRDDMSTKLYKNGILFLERINKEKK